MSSAPILLFTATLDICLMFFSIGCFPLLLPASRLPQPRKTATYQCCLLSSQSMLSSLLSVDAIFSPFPRCHCISSSPSLPLSFFLSLTALLSFLFAHSHSISLNYPATTVIQGNANRFQTLRKTLSLRLRWKNPRGFLCSLLHIQLIECKLPVGLLVRTMDHPLLSVVK